MAKEEIKEEVVVEEPKEEKKGLYQKAKDAILPDADEQAAIISTFVRITVLAWSGGILTLNYVAIPGVPQQKIDPTFIASVFTGVLASFGIQTASKKGDGTMKMDKNGNAVNGNGGGGAGLGGDTLPLGTNDLSAPTPQASAPVPSGGLGVSQF